MPAPNAAVLGVNTGLQVVSFKLGEITLVRRIVGPLSNDSEPPPAIQVSRVTVRFAPVAGGLIKLAMRCQTYPVTVKPTAKPRPGDQQRVVADLHAIPVDGDQPPIHELIKDSAELVRSGAVLAVHQLCVCDPAEGVWGVRRDVNKPEEQQPGGLPLGIRQLLIHLVSGLLDGPADTSDFLVVGHGHPAIAVAYFPRREQRMGQERQGTCLVRPIVLTSCTVVWTLTRDGLQVAQEKLDQSFVDLPSCPPGGLRDGFAQLVLVHRPDDQLTVLQHRPQDRGPRRMGIEVGPQAENNQRRRRTRPNAAADLILIPSRIERCDEGRPLGCVHARREHLLKLVHDQNQSVSGILALGAFAISVESTDLPREVRTADRISAQRLINDLRCRLRHRSQPRS
ncbi:MAG: hypothetical protein M3R63_16600 [Actinomycetota bacterium]|nr:hypothetical protein [Actinomycetota bacterium]